MKRITPLKLTCVGAFVAALGVGCASSGTAQYDASSDKGVSVAASADTGTDQDVIVASSTGTPAQMETGTSTAIVTESGALVPTQPVEGADRITVTAMSFSPDTRASWVSRFPFWEQNFRTIETFTFIPDEDVSLREFTTAVAPGTIYHEAAGGTTAVSARHGRVIQHSPNPR